MAPASNEEQFKFLISCIRYSNNGKVDFGQVAKECKIVSKGAAAKRYERMMRSHGIAPNAASIKPAPSRTPKSERRDSKPTSSSTSISKKRKAEQFLEENNSAEDDDEGYARNIKAEGKINIKEQLHVKEEGDQQQSQLSLDDATNLLQYYDAPSQYGGSQMGGDDIYGVSEYGSPAGYATPIGGSYSIPSQQGFDFGTGYEAVGGGSSYNTVGMGAIPRSEGQALHYQPMMKYSSDNQGRSDSPLTVE